MIAIGLALADWLPQSAVGITFTVLGLVKIHGWKHGVIGGGGKPLSCRLRGRCPSWSKQLNIAFIVVFLGIGLACLADLLATVLK